MGANLHGVSNTLIWEFRVLKYNTRVYAADYRFVSFGPNALKPTVHGTYGTYWHACLLSE